MPQLLLKSQSITFHKSSEEERTKEDQAGKGADDFQSLPAEGGPEADRRRLVVAELQK